MMMGHSKYVAHAISRRKPLQVAWQYRQGKGKYGQTAEGALNAPFCQNHLIYKYLDQIADEEYGADILDRFGGKAQLQGIHLG